MIETTNAPVGRVVLGSPRRRISFDMFKLSTKDAGCLYARSHDASTPEGDSRDPTCFDDIYEECLMSPDLGSSRYHDRYHLITSVTFLTVSWILKWRKSANQTQRPLSKRLLSLSCVHGPHNWKALWFAALVRLEPPSSAAARESADLPGAAC